MSDNQPNATATPTHPAAQARTAPAAGPTNPRTPYGLCGRCKHLVLWSIRDEHPLCPICRARQTENETVKENAPCQP